MQASKLFLGFTLVVLVAAIVGLWQSFSPRPSPPQAPPPVVQTPAPQPAPMEPKLAEPTEPGVRSVYPGGRPSAPARPGAPDLQAQPAAPSAEPAPSPGPSAALPADDGPVDTPAAAAPDTPAAEGEVDLNSASLEALNGLGAGMIGKTIIANRPYASPDELVSRRVLKRQDYEIIKPHVVAR